ARAKGIPVRSITLFIFGGVASIEREPDRPRDEFLIAAAGPFVSLLLGLASLGLWYATRDHQDKLATVFVYLGLSNLILMAFNLIPGFPLDGGRIFRAIVWAITKSFKRATTIAASVGTGVGILFIAIGVYFLFHDPISGLWMMAIGWFLQSATTQTRRQGMVGAGMPTLGMMPVAAVMDRMPATAPPHITLAALVSHYILNRNVHGLPVVDNGNLVGMVTLSDAQRIPQEHWGVATVRDAMTPSERLITAGPGTPIQQALLAMTERGVQQLPVVEGTRLVGLLSRETAMQIVRLQQQPPANQPTGGQPEPRSSWSEPR
ncbi:MAG TPA: site-2 protease family protein, partial [Thermomicrobiaceae bacterium]|nr:site-2 protease family protein [Thermomicrobiaceae bacterium]